MHKVNFSELKQPPLFCQEYHCQQHSAFQEKENSSSISEDYKYKVHFRSLEKDKDAHCGDLNQLPAQPT